MEQNDIQKQLEDQQQALVQIYKSVEKTRKYIMWSGIASLAMFVLPLIVVMFTLPKIIGTFTSSINGLSDSGSVLQSPSAQESFSDALNNLKQLGY
jgi:uncharacterized protein YqhQ